MENNGKFIAEEKQFLNVKPSTTESFDIPENLLSKAKEVHNNWKNNSTSTENLEYIYTFKTLSAEGYDSFITMWTLEVLAKAENKNIK